VFIDPDIKGDAIGGREKRGVFGGPTPSTRNQGCAASRA